MASGDLVVDLWLKESWNLNLPKVDTNRLIQLEHDFTVLQYKFFEEFKRSEKSLVVIHDLRIELQEALDKIKSLQQDIQTHNDRFIDLDD